MNRELKRLYWGRHFWVKVDYASTIVRSKEEIRPHVKWQPHKDQKLAQMAHWRKQIVLEYQGHHQTIIS